ncbi:unnamed protein product [Peronospora belbahrii]|uniref:HSF-type DNA-binding domain-containing protein n=1 Tax=Peronospora belbahrii TaxID=622444 RepID=A0AAU9LDT6_9STRA|nr:unnamed protein product [Peronospora belbahrii]CAH0518170.1 unnamed protein product [Peronospora belbahrii]
MQCQTSLISTKDGITDTTPREVAPFLKSLRRMLQDESAAVLRWTLNGRAFEIHDMHEMMAHVLPKYFKHCKYTSFQRQLNYFNFRKWTKSKAVVCTFSNDFFLRDQPELAWQITRKKSLSPYSLTKYHRPAATKASVMPYWKNEPSTVLSAPPLTFDSSYMLLPGDARCHSPYLSLPFPDTDLMLKQHDVRYAQQVRRSYDFNLMAPTDVYPAIRCNDAVAIDSVEQQTEPLDWIDCLLPPTDDTYMCMYPPQVAITPCTTNSLNMRRSFEFVPSSL